MHLNDSVIWIFLNLFFTTLFFNEFVLKAKNDFRIASIIRRMQEKGIHCGIDISQYYPGMVNCMLLCVTETKTKESIDHLVNEFTKCT